MLVKDLKELLNELAMELLMDYIRIQNQLQGNPFEFELFKHKIYVLLGPGYDYVAIMKDNKLVVSKLFWRMVKNRKRWEQLTRFIHEYFIKKEYKSGQIEGDLEEWNEISRK